MTIEMTKDQALIVFRTLADEIYRTSTCIAPENRKQSRIDLINELRNRIGVELLNAGAIDTDYYNAVCGDIHNPLNSEHD